MRKMRRNYKRPKSPWNSSVIDEERRLLKEFGLKSKKELWKARATLRDYRARAREITATKNETDRKILLDKLANLNILTNSQGIDDVLALSVEDILNRRLQTILFRKNLANTMKQARQLIVHGHVLINDRKMVFPSYFVPASEEGIISVSEEMQKLMAAAAPKPEIKHPKGAHTHKEPRTEQPKKAEAPKTDDTKQAKPTEEPKPEPAPDEAEAKGEGGQ
ncbi:MAG: 30S ribosomal protein S4 [Candidatus Aenigmarchaeota archaeon]|nr:30S ribosomal protein S4 [Candidatus Aenigmarchaeota archaeon]